MYVLLCLPCDGARGLDGRSRLVCGEYGVRMGMDVVLAFGLAMASFVLRRGRPYEVWVLAREPIEVLGVW
jgi:hypothetical protein